MGRKKKTKKNNKTKKPRGRKSSAAFSTLRDSGSGQSLPQAVSGRAGPPRIWEAEGGWWGAPPGTDELPAHSTPSEARNLNAQALAQGKAAARQTQGERSQVGRADLEFRSLEKQRSVNTVCWHGGWGAVILQGQPVPAPRSDDPTCEERFLLAGLTHRHTYSMIEFQPC